MAELNANKTFTWDAAADATRDADPQGLQLGTLDLDGEGLSEQPALQTCRDVKLRFRVSMEGESAVDEYTESEPFALGNSAPSAAGITFPQGRARGTTALAFSPVDADGDDVTLVEVQYSSSGDFAVDALAITVDSDNFPFGALAPFPSTTDGTLATTFGWRSDALATPDSNNAQLAVTLRDALGAYSTQLLSAPFIYDNTNSPPRLNKLGATPGTADAQTGGTCETTDPTCLVTAQTVQVHYVLQDDDADSPSLVARVFDGVASGPEQQRSGFTCDRHAVDVRLASHSTGPWRLRWCHARANRQ